MEYVVVIHPAEEGGYWAEVPALEGCFAQGETVGELLAEVRAAIASHLAALREDAQPARQNDGTIIATVRVPETATA